MKKKENQKNPNLVGNLIDWLIRDMSYGQTNGIPQGSVLMDFIAEMVLGHADTIITDKLNEAKILNYKILRYRDDYRVFTNNKGDGEEILKAISETAHDLGMKLNPLKTGISNDVIRNSFKIDKVELIMQGRIKGVLQKRLLFIHEFAQKHPNSGALQRLLSDFLKYASECKKNEKSDVISMIAIIVDITANNPRTYALASAIISILLTLTEEHNRKEIINKIEERFKRVVNTGFLQIWLQVIYYRYNKEINYSEPLCQFAKGENPKIWNIDWISDKKIINIFEQNRILNKAVLERMNGIITYDEVKIFEARSPAIV